MRDLHWSDEQGDKASIYAYTGGSPTSVAGIQIEARDSELGDDRAVWMNRETALAMRDWLNERLGETERPSVAERMEGPIFVAAPGERPRAQWGDLHLFGYHCRVYNETIDIALSPNTNGRDIIFIPNVKIKPELQSALGGLVLVPDIDPVFDAIDAYQTRTARG